MRSERARSRLPSPTGPMAMARNVTDGRRQENRVDVAADPDLDPDQTAGLGLEESAMIVPANDVRPQQRCEQRHDQSDRDSQ